MIFAASRAISARLYDLVQRFALSNIVIRRIHTRTGLKWGWLAGVGGVVSYGLLMFVASTTARNGGPGWVNLFVLIGFWNAVRFAVLIPVSVLRLLRVRHMEQALQRGAQCGRAFGSGDHRAPQASAASVAGMR